MAAARLAAKSRELDSGHRNRAATLSARIARRRRDQSGCAQRSELRAGGPCAIKSRWNTCGTDHRVRTGFTDRRARPARLHPSRVIDGRPRWARLRARRVKDRRRRLGQRPLQTQGKLLGMTSGRLLEVAVGLRRREPNGGRWGGLEVNGQSYRILRISEAVMHGFLPFDEHAGSRCKPMGAYVSACDCWLRCGVRHLGIAWPLESTMPTVCADDVMKPDWSSCERFE